MTLSFNKLEKLLLTKSLIIRKIYSIGGLCVYIEIMNINNADTILLYIPSKYEIKCDSSNEHNLHYIEISDDGTIPNNYAENPDDIEMAEKYQEIEIEIDKKKGDNIEKYLEESYKCPVSLKDISKEDIKDIKDIFRQLRRIKFCIQGLKYKLCIIYKYYMCCIKRDDTYECFSIENFSTNNKRKLIVTIDLETLYEKIDTVVKDSVIIKKGIFNVLDKNQNKHVRNLQKSMEYKANFVFLSIGVSEEKEKNKDYLEKLEVMLSDILLAETNIIEYIFSIEKEYSNKKVLLSEMRYSLFP